MEFITAALAKRDFELGLLTGFRIDFFSDQISVYLKHKSVPPCYLADARNNQIRNFKTVDAAVNAVRSIGFHVNSLEGK